MCGPRKTIDDSLAGFLDALRDLLDDRRLVVVSPDKNAEMDLVNFAVDEARSKGATYAEARYEKQDPENFILKNGVLDALYVGHDQGIGVRVLVNGALGFAATNSLSKAGVRAIVGDAIKIAKASRRKTKITFAQEDSIAMNWSIPEAKKLADVSVEEKSAEIQGVDRDVTQLGFKLAARYFNLSDNRIRKYFANSEGSRIESYSPRLRVFYFLTVVEGAGVEQSSRNYGWSGGWEGISTWVSTDAGAEKSGPSHRPPPEGRSPPEGTWASRPGPRGPGTPSPQRSGTPRRSTLT